MNRRGPCRQAVEAFFRLLARYADCTCIGPLVVKDKLELELPAAQQWNSFSRVRAEPGGKVAPKTAIRPVRPGALLDPTCQGNDLGATGTSDRVSANRCGHLHIRRRRGWREDGRTDPGAAAPRRPGRELYRGILPPLPRPKYQSRWLVDESQNFYPRLGGTAHLRAQEWRWPRGGKIKFSHLQLGTTVYDCRALRSR